MMRRVLVVPPAPRFRITLYTLILCLTLGSGIGFTPSWAPGHELLAETQERSGVTPFEVEAQSRAEAGSQSIEEGWLVKANPRDGSLILAGSEQVMDLAGDLSWFAVLVRRPGPASRSGDFWRLDGEGLLANVGSLELAKVRGSIVRDFVFDPEGDELLVLVEVLLDETGASGQASEAGEVSLGFRGGERAPLAESKGAASILMRLDSRGNRLADLHLSPQAALGLGDEAPSSETFVGRSLAIAEDGSVVVTGWLGPAGLGSAGSPTLQSLRFARDLSTSTPTPPELSTRAVAVGPTATSACPTQGGNVISVGMVPGIDGFLIGAEGHLDLDDGCLLGVRAAEGATTYGMEIELDIGGVPPPPTLSLDFELHHMGTIGPNMQVRVDLELYRRATLAFENVGFVYVDAVTKMARGPISVSNPAEFVSSTGTVTARLIVTEVPTGGIHGHTVPNCEGGDVDWFDQ